MQSEVEEAVILLVVEDEEDVRLMIADFLRDEGYEVLEAANSPQAKRLLEANADRISLVVTDVRMPGESGIHLVRHVRQNYPAVRVLLASGNVTDSEVGDAPFIMKPFSLSRLAATIGNLLAPD